MKFVEGMLCNGKDFIRRLKLIVNDEATVNMKIYE